MYDKTASWTPRLFVVIILAAIFLAGCAAKKSLWGDPNTGLILQYRMSEGQALKYKISSKITQNVEVMGQSMETKINTGYVFSTRSKGLMKNNHQIGVTIDSMHVDVTSPQGPFSPGLSSVIGKSFDMTISPLGRELDLSGAESITYNMPQSGDRSIVSDFKAIFPDMAGRPVVIGDTWTTRDTINIKDSSSDIHLTFESLNTLTGFETINGLECAKVTAAVKGKLGGTGSQGGADLSFSGDIEASDTWYFAYKEGIFVQATSDGSSKGTVLVSGPQEMTIPMTMKTYFETKLVK